MKWAAEYVVISIDDTRWRSGYVCIVYIPQYLVAIKRGREHLLVD